ncbi:MAG: 3-hydroxyacyl-CoA dehydrogenase family protein [Lachnospiraceae bacterium]|nr:3-hydroxyacyl-CoA dehydrogenase family protein [Lachnospiraceae bacterium]
MEKVGIVGVGQMGADMGLLALAYGYEAVLIGRTEEKAAKGRQQIEKDMEDMIRCGKFTAEKKETCLARLALSDDYRDLADCAFIIEAVVEDPAVKRSVYEKIEQACSEDAVILSETSGILPDELAEGMRCKERFLVAHSWNPPHVIPLVEVVPGKHTSAKALQKAVAFLEALDREVVVLRKAVPGFIGNRIQHAMFREALSLIEEGVATPEEIDKVIYYSIGQRYAHVGLMEYYDSCGLDLQKQVQSYLLADLCNAKGPQKPLTDCLAAGDLGAKTGKGLYEWPEEKREEFRVRKTAGFMPFIRWDEK